MIAATVAIVVGAAFAAPAQAEVYNWDAPNYGWRTIENGHEYTSPRGTHVVTGGGITPARAFSSAHAGAGGGRGALGYPTTGQVGEITSVYAAEGYGFDVDGAYQIFERGAIYGSRITDYYGEVDYSSTVVVKGGSSPFKSVHDAAGGGDGFLSYPIDGEVRQAPGYWYQEFLSGDIYVSPAGAYPVYRYWGGYDYSVIGGGGSAIGYPTGNLVVQGSHYGYQRFERGILYSVPYCYECDFNPLGVVVTGGFIPAHAARGGGSGSLGYPRSPETYNAGTRTWTQIFERGRIEIGPGGTRYFTGKFWTEPGSVDDAREVAKSFEK